MRLEDHPAAHEQIPGAQAAGMIVAFLMFILFPMVYLTGDGTSMSDHPIRTILIGGSIGGVIVLMCFVDPGFRIHAIHPGAVTGAGAVSGLLVYFSLTHGEHVRRIIVIACEGIGMIPGLLLLWLFVKLHPKRFGP